MQSKDEQYCTFQLGGRKATGLLVSKTQVTVKVRVVEFHPSLVYNSIRKQGKTIKRHIEKHNVKIYGPGIVPKTN